MENLPNNPELKTNFFHQKIHAGAAALAILVISCGLAWITAAKATSITDFQIAANPPKTFYVSTGGNNTNPGTSAQPFRTINHAVDQATAGDTIIVRVGVYNERIYLDHTNSGITIKSDINPGTEGCSLSNTRARVQTFQINTSNNTNRANNIRIEGFEITSTRPYTSDKEDAGIWIHGDNIEIVNNRLLFLFKGIWGSYINKDWYPNDPTKPDGPRNVKILNNYVCHTEQGIIVNGYDWLVEGNEVKRPFYYGKDDADYGRFFGHGHVLRRNFFHGVLPEDIQTSHTDGWQHYRYPTDNVIIEENIIQGYRQAIIVQTFDGDTTSVHSITIRNNIFAGFVTPGERFASWGVLISGPESSGPQNIKVYNNLFLDNIFWGVGITNRSEGVVKNNIFYNVAKPYDWPDINNDTLFDYNVIYLHDFLEPPAYPTSEPITGPNDLVGINPQLTKYPLTLADIIGPDGQPFTADDAFLLTATSPAINAGETLADVNQDLLGTSRPQGSSHDIGPYEFNFGGPPPTTQCSDGIDNDSDGLIDSADPGCHTDSNAANSSSYNPSDNDETHTPEPICTDNDGDGFFVEGGSCGPLDCDDSNATLTNDCDKDGGGGGGGSGPIGPPLILPPFGGVGGGGSFGGGSFFSPLGSPAGIGIKVLSIPLKCLPDPCPGPTCGLCSNCLVCGNIPVQCATLYEIKAQYITGINALHYGALGPAGALCTIQNIPPNGGIFSPNGSCLGNIFGLGPHFLYNFGCTKWL